MGTFLQLPYVGTNWNDTAATNAGIRNKRDTGYVGFYGSNANTPNPVCAGCLVGSDNYYTITVGSGFTAKYTGSSGSYNAMNSQYLNTDIYKNGSSVNGAYVPAGTYEAFSSIAEACQAFIQQFEVEGYRNIRYTGNGCIVTGPTFVRQGSSVTAYVTPNIGGNVIASGISVTHNGSPVSFQYNAGILSFTAP